MAEKTKTTTTPTKARKPASTKTAETKSAAPKAAATKTAAPKSAASKKTAETAANHQHLPSVPPEKVAELAHRFWRERGGHHGHHNEDWFRAEQELRGKAS